MNKNEISKNAKKVWMLLCDNSHWDYSKLREESGLSDTDLSAALGWLAREDKVQFDPYCDEPSVFLSVNVYIG
ncbi:MAG: winged helix-turn-helix domain-containing protein [Mediterranea sp.]|jgi:hypothetical protein|nr:winged helix-turn-helix domain-containing protein [Mediterranea sp.]